MSEAVEQRRARGRRAVLAALTAHAPRLDAGGRAMVVLVEGLSDQAAVRAVARRYARDLDAEQIFVVPMGGATNIAHYLAVLGPQGLDVRLAGLCDAGEEPAFATALRQLAPAPIADRETLSRANFFVCEADLEDELIRALGPAAAEQVVADQGELPAFRTLQRQPAQRARTHEQQLHRFLGAGSGRKIRYATHLVEALDHLPAPLHNLLNAL